MIRLILALALMAVQVPAFAIGTIGPSGVFVPPPVDLIGVSCMSYAGGCCCETPDVPAGPSCCGTPKTTMPAECLCDHGPDGRTPPAAPAPNSGERTIPAPSPGPVALVPAGDAIDPRPAPTSPARVLAPAERRALLCIWTT